MKLLKSSCHFFFSMYSGIPMPQFEWKEEDMKYMLCFFSMDWGGDRTWYCSLVHVM